MPLTTKLKSFTSDLHRRLENKMVPHIKSLRSVNDYKKLLSLFYGFFGSLELNINSRFDTKLLPDIASRRKADQLAKDIAALPGDAVAAPGPGEAVFITNSLQALGALYVMEGSTLGGQVITGMIKRSLNDEHIPLSFFNGYGEQTMPMWMTFKTTLDNLGLSEADEATVIAAANETFKRFADYIDINGWLPVGKQ